MKKLRLRMIFYLVTRRPGETSLEGVLAYVFWHRPRARAQAEVYAKKLIAFQSSLKAHPPGGFVEALSFRIPGSPWSRRPGRAFEDWYLVRDFSCLGLLNAAAVTTPNKRPHDEVASDAAVGTGGLYRRAAGGLGLRDAQFATWIRKPAGKSYQSFFDDLGELRREGPICLWQRQMVLGPAPEFCLHSGRRLDLPSELRPRTIPLELVAKSDGRSRTRVQEC